MAPPVDPIAAATLTFTLAAKAWTAFKTALQFSDNSNDLLLHLDIEQARFHIWSKNAGYERAGDKFDHCLLPVIDLIDSILEKIISLFEDVGQLRTRYGLTNYPTAGDESVNRQRFLANLAKALHVTGMKTTPALEDNPNQPPLLPPLRRTSTFNRFKWGVRDKMRFQQLVELPETYVLKLNQLLTETRQRKLAEDSARLNALVVSSIEDETMLRLVKRAALVGLQDYGIRNLCSRLALSDRMRNAEISLDRSQLCLSLSEFPCLAGSQDVSESRILTQQKSAPTTLVLLEKKTYPPGISQAEFNSLKDLIERIVLLLCIQRGDLSTLQCLGYIHDGPRRCWWIASNYPTVIPTNLSNSPVPLSLLDLFADKSPLRAPLETRINLAHRLASSISSLFSSSWLHKSIRSENILFPQLGLSDASKIFSDGDAAPPFLAGFEYSRQHKDSSLGKPEHKDVNCAIYRHPFYLGQNPGPYRIHYDVYSFGLVLVEIARWMPLLSLLDNKRDSAATSTAPQLSRTMKTFNQANGMELRKRALYIVEKDLAFRVGTSYRDAVRWCLTCADDNTEGDARERTKLVASAENSEWRPALAFFDNVVVSLERLALKFGAKQ